MSPINDLSPLLTYCQEFRRRLARLLALVGGARVVCLAIALFAALSLIDWWFHWNGWIRFATLLGYLAAVVVLAMKGWNQLRGSASSDREVLHQLGLRSPETSSHWLVWYELITAREQIEELQSSVGQEMAESAKEQLATKIESPVWEQVFDTGSVRRWMMAAGCAVGLLFLAAFVAIPEHIRIGAVRLFVPFSTLRWPHRTTIDIAQPANGWTVPQLESFPIQAKVTGEIPARVTLAYRTASSSTWVREKLPLREDNTILYTFPEVREPVQFYLTGGDFQTDPLRIEIVARPFLKAITAHYSYPAYARLPDRTAQGGQLAGLEGTKVKLELESSMPLSRAVMVMQRSADAAAAEERIELTKKSATQFTHELMLASSGQYAVELFEPHGFREAKPEVYEIRVTPDDPPEVELLSPTKDLVETNQASIEVALKARDQLGLSRVAIYYQMGDAEPQPLSDVITGPIIQTGSESQTRFTWELRKLELAEQGTLQFFARVRDNNPTGRGQRDSVKRQIKLVRPSEFHLEAIEQAKLLEEETRIAWKNQLQAWETSQRWREESAGGRSTTKAEGDPLWNEMQEAQQRAFQATKQVRVHLQTLTEKFERNHMGQDFMAGRLSVVAELLVRLQEKEHAPIATSLQDARPQTTADAAPDRLTKLRSGALDKSQDHQKLAVLILERMLRKLYDWRDLQSATITTKLLHEQQEEVLTRTEQVAPKTIAKEIEDLSDQDQDRLLTLGKQQRAIFDSETGLEQQLTYMMYKAEKQVRKSILDPLRAAFTNLRNNRVNDHLKQSADLIANNQPSQIINSQKAALRALKVVQAGLVAAGQKVDEDEPLTLAMSPTTAAQFDPDQIKPQEVASKEPESMTDNMPVDSPAAIELPTLPEGSDALSAAVRLAIELEDNVLARMRYLAKNRTSAEMPRFVELKLLRMRERQQDAVEAISRAGEINDPKAKPTAKPMADISQSEMSTMNDVLTSPHVAALLAVAREEFLHAEALVKQGEIEESSQQLQAHGIETLQGILHNISFRKAIDDATAENRRLNGVDAFNRSYFLRGKDLEETTNLVVDLHYARQRQAHATRVVERLAQHPAAGKKGKELEAISRKQAADSQQLAADTVSQLVTRTESLSPPVVERIRTAGLGNLAALPLGEWSKQLAAGKTDAAVGPQQKEALQQFDATLLALRDLFEERIRPEPKVVTKVEDAPKMTLEEYQRLTSPEKLAELLKAESSLPPELREIMARSLAQELPPKYRELLTAYFASFVKKQPQAAEEQK